MERRSPAPLSFVACIVFALVADAALATDLEPVTKLTADAAVSGSGFGQTLAIDGGNLVATGAPFDNQTGAAHVLRRDGATWSEEQKLTAGDAASGDFFGVSVAVDGDVVLVGAGLADGFRGAAYAFRRVGASWIEEQKLVPADAIGGDQLGFAVAIDGDVALVGAVGADQNRGSVYVFRYDGTTWIEEQELVASDGAALDSFGTSIAIENATALIGANTHDSSAGAVYAFTYDGAVWNETQKLVAADATSNDSFGCSVAIDGNTAVIGARDKNSPPMNANEGAVYVFRFDGVQWIEEQKLLPNDLTDVRGFGTAVSIEGATALVGAVGVQGGGTSRGAAYAFEYDGAAWTESPQIVSADPADFDAFGSSVALGSPFAFVGCPGDDETLDDSGSVHVFGAVRCLAGTVNAGSGAVVDALGINGSTGGSDRTVLLEDGDFVEVLVLRPIAGGNGGFVLHANLGTPDVASQAVLPFDLGVSCFPLLLPDGATPVLVANNIGKQNLVGESSWFGLPTPDPDRATTTLHYPPLPTGTTLTFQAVILDPAATSAKGASLTNAVMVEVLR